MSSTPPDKPKPAAKAAASASAAPTARKPRAKKIIAPPLQSLTASRFPKPTQPADFADTRPEGEPEIQVPLIKPTAPIAAKAASKMPAFMASWGLLHWAFAASIAFHVVLLSIRFVDPEAFNRAFTDTPLEVILVNAKSQLKPEVAQAIAQANLDGGGASEKGRAKSPLPSAALNAEGDAPADEKKRVEEMQDTQARLLAQIKTALAQKPEDFKSMTEAESETAEEERRKQLLKMLAEIESRIDEENKRPRKRFISPATREAVYAQYYDALKKRVEAKGTQNFPELAGQKLYGELTMVMLVNARGRLIKTEIVQSSGNRRLDRMAEAIAANAGPFGAFSAEMRKSADQVEVVSRFKFARDETLKASLEAAQQ
jgi:periplasmic protein TonB